MEDVIRGRWYLISRWNMGRRALQAEEQHEKQQGDGKGQGWERAAFITGRI